MRHAVGAVEATASGYPRPQVVRHSWTSLDGIWEFAFDDDDRGLREHWEREGRFDQRITVPYPPEAPDSGVQSTGLHPVCWYRREVGADDLPSAGSQDRYLLHFGAVDYEASVWVDGRLAGTHRGGQTPFSFDITDLLDPAGQPHGIVVRCFDDPQDVEGARGKQDWREKPHAVWYERTSGIWQSVWLETVPMVHVEDLAWASDSSLSMVTATVRLSRRPAGTARVHVELGRAGEALASCAVESTSDLVEIPMVLASQRNGQEYEGLLWSPENPILIDATVTVDADGSQDVVQSYLGLRSVEVAGRRFLLNDRPYTIRAVLSQGYWPGSHLAASPETLRAEVELIRQLGFNAVRVHQKAEDPRFLFWCDYLGLAVWAESGSAYEYSTRGAARYAGEWAELVQRDRSHPSIVTWVPLNESWGVQHIGRDRAQQAFARGLADLTRALDPTRPVISNDGWEHTNSDIVTIHDYADSPAVISRCYGDPDSLATLIEGFGPAGRRIRAASPGWNDGAPIMLTEFGGVAYAHGAAQDDGWGYSSAADAADFENRVAGLVAAVRESPLLAGFCYTQLTDTRQEINGLCDDHRRPKLPAEHIRRIVAGPGASD